MKFLDDVCLEFSQTFQIQFLLSRQRAVVPHQAWSISCLMHPDLKTNTFVKFKFTLTQFPFLRSISCLDVDQSQISHFSHLILLDGKFLINLSPCNSVSKFLISIVTDCIDT